MSMTSDRKAFEASTRSEATDAMAANRAEFEASLGARSPYQRTIATAYRIELGARWAFDTEDPRSLEEVRWSTDLFIQHLEEGMKAEEFHGVDMVSVGLFRHFCSVKTSPVCLEVMFELMLKDTLVGATVDGYTSHVKQAKKRPGDPFYDLSRIKVAHPGLKAIFDATRRKDAGARGA